jgi:hypothetical protein
LKSRNGGRYLMPSPNCSRPKWPKSRLPRLIWATRRKLKWLPPLGISYDPHDDVVDIALDGVDHIIRKPREIYLDDGAAGLRGLEIVEANGVKQIVKLKERLMLPAPQS